MLASETLKPATISEVVEKLSHQKDDEKYKVRKYHTTILKASTVLYQVSVRVPNVSGVGMSP